MSTGLTQRQDTFVTEYAKDGNATQAAVRAGYSATSARVTGHRLLTNAALQQRLKQAGQQGLETLMDIAANGQNEAARVHAAAILMERAYGKPLVRSQDDKTVTIVFKKVDTQGDTSVTVPQILAGSISSAS